jgi:hypothetical protein
MRMICLLARQVFREIMVIINQNVVLTLDTSSHIVPGLQELPTRKLEEALFG